MLKLLPVVTETRLIRLMHVEESLRNEKNCEKQ